MEEEQVARVHQVLSPSRAGASSAPRRNMGSRREVVLQNQGLFACFVAPWSSSLG